MVKYLKQNSYVNEHDNEGVPDLLKLICHFYIHYELDTPEIIFILLLEQF